MAEEKVNRNNHPILIKARRESYFAGRKEGYNDGYATGFSCKCETVHNYYKNITHALERRVDVLTKELAILRDEDSAYSQGYREGFRAAKEDIRYTVEEMQRCINGILGESDD